MSFLKGNRMDKYKTAGKINKLLENFAGLKIEFLGQEPYQSDCWKIFSKADDDIFTDELNDLVRELFEEKSTKTNLKLKLLEQLMVKWREWDYARKQLST